MEYILPILLICIIWIIYPKPKEWYLFEWRVSLSETIKHNRLDNESGFGSTYKMAHKHSVQKNKNAFTINYENGEIIQIEQMIFQDFSAASEYFENSKGLIDDLNAYGNIYLWRVVARNRRKAYVVPPTSYIEKESLAIKRYPVYGIHKPKPNENGD